MRRARCRSSPCASSCNRVGRSGALRHRACRRGGRPGSGVAGGLGPGVPDRAGRGLARPDVSGGDEPERRAVRAVGVTVSRRRRKWPENVAPRRAWSVPSPFESCHGRLMSIGREHAAARSRERIGGMVGKRRSVIRVSPSPGREGPGRRRSIRHPPRAFAREPPGQDGARRRPSRRTPPRGAPARWATAHCTDGAHGTVRAHSFQVCLAPAHRPALRFAPRRHRRDAALGGARADARNVSGAGMMRDRAAHAQPVWIHPAWAFSFGAGRR